MIERQEQPFEDVAKLLGHNVKLILDWEDPEGTITGYLFGLNVEGEAIVDSGDDGRHFVWPVLYAEHLENCCKNEV